MTRLEICFKHLHVDLIKPVLMYYQTSLAGTQIMSKLVLESPDLDEPFSSV